MSEGNGKPLADQLEEIGENFAPRLDVAAGDAAKAIHQILLRMPDAYARLHEVQQEALILACKGVALQLVRKSFLAMYADRRIETEAGVKDFKATGKGIELRVVLPPGLDDEAANELMLAARHTRTILLAMGMQHYLAEGEPIKAAPDEPELPLDESAKADPPHDPETGEILVTPAAPKQLTDYTAAREASELDPEAVGYAKGLEGVPDSANTHPLDADPSSDYEKWRRGHARGFAKRLENNRRSVTAPQDAPEPTTRRGRRRASPSVFSPG